MPYHGERKQISQAAVSTFHQERVLIEYEKFMRGLLVEMAGNVGVDGVQCLRARNFASNHFSDRLAHTLHPLHLSLIETVTIYCLLHKCLLRTARRLVEQNDKVGLFVSQGTIVF